MSLLEQQDAPPCRDHEFWREHYGNALVWSTDQASDELLIFNALLRPNFHLILDIAVRFGLERLEEQWTLLKADTLERNLPEELRKLERAQPIVDRSLQHIREGFQQT